MKRILALMSLFVLLLAWLAQATISSETSKVSYSCNGSTTVYAYTYKIFEDDDLLVLKYDSAGTPTTLTVTTDYTVSGVGDDAGGNVTLTAGSKCGSGYTLTIRRNIEFTQETDYVEGDLFPADAHENALDKLTMQVQQVKDDTLRAIKLPKNTTTDQEIVGSASARANKAIIFNASGNVTISTDDFENSATNAAASAASALTYSNNASTSASNAQTYANNASTYATNASNSATAASNSATLAQSYVGSVKVSSNDTTPAVLGSKLVAGSNITLTENNDGGNETLTVAVDSSGLGTNKWTALVATTDFSTTAASTSTITMNTDQTANILVGYGIKFTLSSTVYYAQVTALTANLMTIRGAPLTTGAGALTALSYSPFPTQVEQIILTVDGYFEDATSSTLLKDDMRYHFKWGKAKAYLVGFDIIQRTVDTGAEANINVMVNGAAVSTANTNQGPTLSGTADTWVSTVVDISTSNYDINYGETIELQATKAGNGDAVDLTVSTIWVFQFIGVWRRKKYETF